MRKIVVVGIALVTLSSSAFTQSVNTDFDPTFNFATIKTYYWAKTTGITPNPIADTRIVNSVDNWLQLAGWERTEGKGDLALVPNLSTQTSQTLNTFYDGFGGGWGYGAGFGTSTTTVSTFVEGTMVLDMFDPGTKKLVWRGIARDTISNKPQDNAKKIDKAAEKMFKDRKKFPPKPKT
jgi:uncharacterized protein DUF4136